MPEQETKTGTKPECPVCGAAAKVIQDDILVRQVAVLTCGCYGHGERLLEDCPPPREVKVCPGCGQAESRKWLPLFEGGGRWLYTPPECADDCPEILRQAAEYQRRLEEGERQRLERERHDRLYAASIPERFSEATLESFQDFPEFTEALRKVKAFNAQSQEHLREGRGLWLVGPTGVGKTHLLVAVFRKAVVDGWKGFFCTGRQYMRRLTDSYRDREVLSPLPGLVSVPLLLLDDIGSSRTDRNPEHVREAFLDLLDERYLAKRPTLVSSNLTAKELREDLDERITSRLCEMCERVSLVGADYRMRQDQRARERAGEAE